MVPYGGVSAAIKSAGPYTNDDVMPITSVIEASWPLALYVKTATCPNGSVNLVTLSGSLDNSYESVVTWPMASVAATRRKLESYVKWRVCPRASVASVRKTRRLALVTPSDWLKTSTPPSRSRRSYRIGVVDVRTISARVRQC